MSTVKADNFTWKSGESGGQPQYTVSADKVILGTAKAWVNYNASTLAANKSFNVSSITSNATGDKTINLSSAFVDAYYTVYGSNVGDTQASYACFICAGNAQTLTSSTARHRVQNYGGSLYDATTVSICFTR